ncbi:PPE family protein [[Mycobacterium] crassicus]|uniref:PPE family protein n=1 Tax=[Mycobacterium] crassicus TaxID=2872309 RepID=A0ABU5XCH8_9MYCO|nr:PPE family protein [Mycolicibacter sp. MYC098]MEB3020010.1 PPE family protein [Mycolicibacter sp. MYC098]
MLDFGVLPPEVTSTQIYSGPGATPMVSTAAAWDGLAAQLNSFAEGYSSVISALEGDGWAGPSANAMAVAAASYVQWVTATAGQAEQVAGQARLSAAAFEAAHAAVVPPALVAANRTQLTNLVATNIFGQNTPKIAANEAQYAGMWAQNTQAMYGYAGASSTSAKLAPFTEPPQTTNPAGQSAQAAATAVQAAGTSTSQSQNWLTDLLQALSSPGTSATSSSDTTSLFGLPIPDSVMTDLGDINTILGMPNAAGGGLRSVANVVSMTVALFRLWADAVLYAPLAGLTGAISPVAGLPGGVLAGTAVGGAERAVLAGVGGAGSVGQMSVPPAWTQATPVATASEQPLWLSEVESWWEAGAPANLGAQTMAEVAAAAAAGTLLMRPVVGKALRVPPRQFKMSRPSSGG